MPQKNAAWTVMVYLAGDNNLSEECVFALTEMRKAGSNSDIHVIAQFDPNGDFLPTHRYAINRNRRKVDPQSVMPNGSQNGNNDHLSNDIIDEARFNERTREVHFRRESKRANSLAAFRHQERKRIAARKLGAGSANIAVPVVEEEDVTNDTDTGSPITLYNFLSYCIQEYPADHYMAVLSGHAGGTERDFLLKDESTAGSLTFNELKGVFKELKENDLEGRVIDIVGMDNCLMSMGEICYELKDLVQVLVGCESYSPASGWPYREILKRMQVELLSGTSSVASFAKAIVEEYANFYADYWLGGTSVAQSALDVNQVSKLKELVDVLAKELETALTKEDQESHANGQDSRLHQLKDAVILAHWEAQSYNGEQFVDLYDFCDCLEKRLPNGPITEACKILKGFISNEFILRSCYSGAVYQYSYGVSIYFPWAQVANSYENLDFVKDSGGAGWGSFLHSYTALTRREPRGGDATSKLSEANSTQPQKVRKTSDRKTSDRGMVTGNPIQSMRNPPVVFVPTDCIRQQKSVIWGQNRLYFQDGSAD
jgi:Clostripain family